MENKNTFDKKNTKIIETVEYNGKYTDISTVKNHIMTRVLTVGALVCAAAVLIGVQIFWL